MEPKSYEVVVMKHESVMLPEDLVTEILLRLPVKSLLRSKLVCKRWRSIINSASFITRHHRFNEKINPLYHLIYTCHIGKETSNATRILSHDTLGLVDRTAVFPPNFPPLDGRVSRSYRLAGSCNGLVLVHRRFDDISELTAADSSPFWGEWHICNLATGESRLLPLPSSLKGKINFLLENKGLAFDPKSKDYKAIVMHKIYPERTALGNTIRVDVYSLRTDSWKNITSSLTNGRSIGSRSEKCLWVYGHAAVSNGKISFPVKAFEEDRPRHEPPWSEIMSFDVSSEEMLITQLPLSANELRRNLSLFSFNDSLAVARFAHDGSGLGRSCDVWMLGEYGVKESWIKLFSTEPHQGIARVLGFWKDDKWFVQMQDSMLYLFDRSTQQTTSLGIQRGNMFTYHESLVSIGRCLDHLDLL